MDTKRYNVMARFGKGLIDYYLVRAKNLEEAEEEFFSRVESETEYTRKEVIIIAIAEE